MSDILSKLKSDPFGLIRRAVTKLLVAPIKYRSANGYDAARYWEDRLSMHGRSLKGVGDEGLTEDENQRMYLQAGQTLLALCRSEGVDFRCAKVLEIGCGTGYYTQLLAEQGVRSYVGIDITDIFFTELKTEYPEFNFLKRDITQEEIDGEYDLVLMIDVIEHITQPEKLSAALKQVTRNLSAGGVFIIAPVPKKGRRSLFYVRFWSIEDILLRFKGFRIGVPQDFRYSQIVAIRKP